MGSAGEAHIQAIHVVSGQTFHWRQPAFANYYLLSWQTSSFYLSLSLSHLLEKAFTAHTYGTLSVPFGPIIFRCDSSPCFSIKLLMKATINKAWVHRTDTAWRRERGRREKHSLCAKTRGWCWEDPDGVMSNIVSLSLSHFCCPVHSLSFFHHSPRTAASCFHAKQNKNIRWEKERMHADCS